MLMYLVSPPHILFSETLMFKSLHRLPLDATYSEICSSSSWSSCLFHSGPKRNQRCQPFSSGRSSLSSYGLADQRVHPFPTHHPWAGVILCVLKLCKDHCRDRLRETEVTLVEFRGCGMRVLVASGSWVPFKSNHVVTALHNGGLQPLLPLIIFPQLLSPKLPHFTHLLAY